MAHPRALWRGRGPPRHLWPVAVALWFAVAQVSAGDEGAPRNLNCFKACCCQTSWCRPNCSWEAGSRVGASYTLHFWYPDHQPGKRHAILRTGNATSLFLDRVHVYAEVTVTVWVESRVRRHPPLRSNNLTLVFNQAVRLTAPTDINFSRSRGHMTLTWTEPTTAAFRPGESGQMRPAAHANLTTGNCKTQKEHKAMEIIAVRCPVEGNAPYEVQVRYRTPGPYSDWSDWSRSAFVPAEILRSPELNCSAEPLREDGLRRVTLEWQKPSWEQGEVDFTLTFVLLPCLCLDESETLFDVRNGTSFQGFLSGAEYNISLQAANRASRPPASFCRLPAEQGAVGPTFQEVIQSGRNFSVTWGTKHEVICFEKDPGRSCEDEDIREVNETSWSGTLEPDVCSRLAVHAWDPEEESWSTLGLVRLFHRGAPSEDRVQLVVVSPTPTSADIHWDPPAFLAGCPSVLHKYVICWHNERGEEIATYEVNASETRFTISDLQPNTTYRVGVGVSTAGSDGRCRDFIGFRTRPADSKKTTLTLSFLLLGLVGGVLVVASTVHICKKRAKEVLCPPLPDPADTEAVKILARSEPGQVHPRLGFMQPLESSSPTEPLVLEPRSPSKEDPSAGTAEDFPALANLAEETLLPKEEQPGSGGLLPSEYKGQGFLSPMEDDRQGRPAGRLQ
ncbi:LOW QUALITY PROTEIN: interleukin-12 receptor subunit beta-1 [Lacerta agilis]|uniref:LOW QUALITY PROTEIN: interleukin-12 receptor subunit beta-1 n=1 Tax=Lacerta agilis TaxID=80427 RepID=UPI001419254F|nr:LOW QUALITY PROTEIN: interleukin-12 receptor subunit beta-1 [Lacerta agilis]